MSEQQIMDVHTRHCCLVHGCKYADPSCTVVTRRAVQEGSCEHCSEQQDTPVEALAAALRYIDSDAYSIAAVATGILGQLTAAGYSIVPTAEVERLQDNHSPTDTEMHLAVKLSDAEQRLAAKTQRVSRMETYLIDEYVHHHGDTAGWTCDLCYPRYVGAPGHAKEKNEAHHKPDCPLYVAARRALTEGE